MPSPQKRLGIFFARMGLVVETYHPVKRGRYLDLPTAFRRCHRGRRPQDQGLGIALPGNGTIPAVYSERIRLAKHAGMKVMELVAEDITALDIINEHSSEV